MSDPNQLIGKRVPVLDKGWLELQDMMGDDLAIVNAARVSFLGESKGPEQDKKLLFYLLRHRHTTPFEQVEFKFRVRAPVIVWWQWARHRMWHYNAQCLAGDTEVIFNRPDALRRGNFTVGVKIRLADLYRRWHSWEKRKIQTMNLRCVDEETMALSSAHIGDVVYAGRKAAFKITTADGREITSSQDHRFLFEDGWQTLGEATGLQMVNGRAVWNQLPSLYVNGKPLETADLYTDKTWLKYQYHTRGLTIQQVADLAGCSTHTIRKYLKLHDLTLPERAAANHFKNGDTPWNYNKSYSLNETLAQNLARRERARESVKRGEDCHFWKGGVSEERANIARWTKDISSYIFARDEYHCQFCGGLARDDDRFHAHHIVPVWADEGQAYDPDNLVTVHETCHRRIHSHNLELDFARQLKQSVIFDMARKNDRAENRRLPHSHATPHLVEITNIEYVGVQEMYDLVVDGPYPNFIANWFVLHNSGRYTPFEENDFYVPAEWRRQSADNKQGSEGVLEPPEADELTVELLAHYEKGFSLYKRALAAGVAREQARLFLSGFSVYYTWVAKTDAHNLMHFLSLRTAPDAQYEIRAYAQALYDHFFRQALPWTAEAFEKYILAKYR